LFVGTQPKGRIYVHNFQTEEEYLFVETEDSSVTAFSEYNGKLFVGTAPAGIVYSFDGLVWKEEHRPYGHGVTTMATSDAGLFVFSNGAEGPVVFNGSSWIAYSNDNVENPELKATTGILVASNRISENGIYGTSGFSPIDRNQVVANGIETISNVDIAQTNPQNPQFNVTASAQSPSGPIFGGTDNGVVLMATQNGLTKLFDAGIPISALAYVNSNCIVAASDETVILARETT
jgi:hypothetical protein